MPDEPLQQCGDYFLLEGSAEIISSVYNRYGLHCLIRIVETGELLIWEHTGNGKSHTRKPTDEEIAGYAAGRLSQ